MNKLKHLALIIKEIQSEHLSDLLGAIQKYKIKEFSLYAESKPHIALPKIKFNFFEYGKAKERLLKRIKDTAQSELDLHLDNFEEHLLETKDPPDLIINASQNNSLANNVIIEANYAEIFLCQKDDFAVVDLELAIKDFEERKRNFGN